MTDPVQRLSELRLPPLAIYVHMPWCVRKCPYCDFNSHPLLGALPARRYLDALQKDLALQSSMVVEREVVSVFFGGGTPSLFSPTAMQQVITSIRSFFSCADKLEITLEANPGAIERSQFRDYRAAGINRVSIGAQSFNPAHLSALGRIHSAEETTLAAEELHAAGMDNFNIDLMYGLPGQTLSESQNDVRTALALAPAHVSHYQLTLEPGTAFFYRPPPLPEEDLCWEMQLRCQAELLEHGFAQYEISAYASRERRCRHNLNYWQFGDYVGVGAGAHGKLTHLGELAIYRMAHARQPRVYMEELEAGRGAAQLHPVPQQQLPFEFMLNALRLIDGFKQPLFCERTGLRFATIAAIVEQAIDRGLLEGCGVSAWRPSARGLQFLNELQMMFLPPKEDVRRAQTHNEV